MIASFVLLSLISLQLAAGPPTPDTIPAPVATPVAAAAAEPSLTPPAVETKDAAAPPPQPQVAAPAPDPNVQFRIKALHNFWSMNYAQLGPEEWAFLGMYYGTRALMVITLMTLAWTLSGWSSTALSAALGRVRFDETLSIFLAKLLRYSILLLVALTCLSYFGVETTGFAAVIGAAGLAIGLAFQGTLSNFAAGAMLLIFRPYKVGDTVVVAGHAGKVAEIELFTTTIDTPDRRRIIVPNSSIYGTVIENITFHPARRIDVAVGTAYAADIDVTRHALERALRSVPAIVSEPPPEVALAGLGASSVDWMVNGYARREQFGEAKQALLRAVKLELDHAGIGIPYPQLAIHIATPAAEESRRAA